MKHSYSQDQPFRIKGHWWIPGASLRVAGDLVYKETSIQLKLCGALCEATRFTPFHSQPEVMEHAVIHGESLDKQSITLFEGFYTSWNPDISLSNFVSEPGAKVQILKSQLEIRCVLTGNHFSSKDDGFTRCQIEVPHFETWLGCKPFCYDNSPTLDQFSVTYRRPEDEYFFARSLDSEIRFVHSVRLPSLPTIAPTIQHRSVIQITPKSTKSARWFQKAASDLVDLLSIFYGGNLVSRKLRFFRNPADHEGVAVYFPRYRVKVPDYHFQDLVLTQKSLRENFERLLNSWLDAPKSVKQARAMMFSSERRPSDFIELRFLPLIHAAEMVAREYENMPYVDSQTFQTVRKRIEEALDLLRVALPMDFIASIKNSLSFANGGNLRRNLSRLLDSLSESLCSLFCATKNDFISGLVSTRNYYTHYSDNQTPLRHLECHWAIRKLQLMLRIIFLTKIGVPEDVIEKAIHGHIDLSRERDVWRNLSEVGRKEADEGE
jgi:hypothetical protein